MTLYVVRHGEATLNVVNNVCGGRSDVPLTEKGCRQAEALASKLPHIDRVICSPMIRARQTADILMREKSVPIEIDPRLREMDFGKFEGTERGTPEFMKAKSEPACRFSGGESGFQTAARVYSLLDELKGEKSGDSVLLVCHGAIMRIIETYFRDMPMEEYIHYSPENCKPVCYQL